MVCGVCSLQLCFPFYNLDQFRLIHFGSHTGNRQCNKISINRLNAELNPIRHLLALVEARHIVHVSRIMVNITNVLLLLLT